MRLPMALIEAGRPMSLRELAAKAKLTSSKAHRYLVSLGRVGLVQQSEPNGPYDIGPLAITMGAAALSRLDEPKIATGATEKLRDETDLTALVVAWSPEGPIVAQRYEPISPLSISARVGSTLPLLSSAAGLVFAAFLPAKLTSRLVERELKSRTSTHLGEPITASAVKELLDDIRATKVAYLGSDLIKAVDAVAAPVFNVEGRLAFVFALSGPQGSIELRSDGRIAKMLLRAAEQASTQLGFMPKADEPPHLLRVVAP